MVQNKYDDNEFFNEYMKLRDKEDNANIIEEQPALFSLLPTDLTNKKILDLGCGFGANTNKLINLHTSRVVGVDLSSKMLEIAKKENKYDNVEYLCMDLNEIDKIEEKFDIIISSLSFHYIKDFNKLINNIYNLLNKDGVLIFSQEHPITLAPKDGINWTIKDNIPVHFNLSNYQEPGERNIFWLTNNVIKYHRTISNIINTLIDNKFIIKKVLEPNPIQKFNDNTKNIEVMHKPHFLIIKVIKNN